MKLNACCHKKSCKLGLWLKFSKKKLSPILSFIEPFTVLKKL